MIHMLDIEVSKSRSSSFVSAQKKGSCTSVHESYAEHQIFRSVLLYCQNQKESGETRYGARTLNPATCNLGRSSVNASDLFVALKYSAVTEHPAVTAIEPLGETSPTRTTAREFSPPIEHLQRTPRAGPVISEQRSIRP
ncbi:hypothetical protein HN873_008079 [Arachis hypogaea]